MFHSDSLLESVLDASSLTRINFLFFNRHTYENQTHETQVASLVVNVAGAVCVAGTTAGVQS